MRVLLIRHGAAVGQAFGDASRWLTDGGRADTIDVAARLRALGVAPAIVFTSPLVRAVQTAEILTQHLFPGDRACPVEVHPPLSCHEGSVAEAAAILKRAREGDTLCLVTHMPKVSALAARLLHQSSFAAFPTTGVCCLDIEADAQHLAWVLSPHMPAPGPSFY